MRHFIDLRDFSADTLQMMLDDAHEMKQARRAGIGQQPLAGKTVAMIFESRRRGHACLRNWHCSVGRHAASAFGAGFAAWARRKH